jgi:hypothetical protein
MTSRRWLAKLPNPNKYFEMKVYVLRSSAGRGNLNNFLKMRVFLILKTVLFRKLFNVTVSMNFYIGKTMKNNRDI